MKALVAAGHGVLLVAPAVVIGREAAELGRPVLGAGGRADAHTAQDQEQQSGLQAHFNHPIECHPIGLESMAMDLRRGPYNHAMGDEELPGHDLVEQGVTDLSRGVESVPALLVAIGAPRLRRLGLPVPDGGPDDPEHRLYRALSRSGPDSAHSRYNALLRKLISFERAAECAS
jgi:hypothetical protein